jgi:hypothetical protein
MNPCDQSHLEEDRDIDIRAVYAGAKRRIAALEQQLQNIKDAVPKRRMCR